MMQSRWVGRGVLIAWAVALAACGGGGRDEGPSSSSLAQLRQASTSPAALPESKLLKTASGASSAGAKSAVHLSQAQARAPGQALAAPTATAFLDWAERTFPEFFPGPQTDRLLLPYVYRHYPGTDIYLAVNGELIYALGPVTGNQVVALGKLSDFACLVSPASCVPPPAPVGSGLASDCFNAAVFAQGSTYRWDYQISGGGVTGVMSSTGATGGPVFFGGYADVIELRDETTFTYSAPADLAALGPQISRSTEYGVMDGLDFLSYGDTSVWTLPSGQTSTNTTVNQPAARNRLFSLMVGESSTVSYLRTTIVDGKTLPGGTQVLETVTYLGQELVSVPAGTFMACKFSYADDSTPAQFQWLAKGSGAPLKLLMNDTKGQSGSWELLAGSHFNGAPIAPQ